MGGSSSTSAKTFNHYKPSPAKHHKTYHVFLSFRGTKVRNTLVAHLVKSLSKEGFRVFVDSEILDEGKNTGVSREEAIKDSTVHIPIFSPDYGRSPSCLDDLSHSWNCKHMCTGSIIIPLFYNVKPSDVDLRYPESLYAKEFQPHRKIWRRSEQQLDLWMEALHQISDLPGWSLEESADGDEDRLVELVVTDLLKTLPSPHAAKDQTTSGLRYRGPKSKDSYENSIKLKDSQDSHDLHQMQTFSQDHLSAQSCPDWVHYITDKASEFSLTVIAGTLGNYGSLLSTPVFWLCWSIFVTEAVIFHLNRPYWMWRMWKWRESATLPPREDAWVSHYCRAGAVFCKVGMSVALIVMLIVVEDLSKRQNKTLLVVGLLIILLEGFRNFFVKEKFKSSIRNSSEKGMHMIQSRTPSVINAMIVMTGGIVWGGILGTLMRQKPYWIFVSVLVVDLIAEAVHQFDYGNRSNSNQFVYGKGSNYIVIVIVLRLIVGGSLCYCMTKEILQKSYFPSHVDATVCDLKCQERSKSLLITMVVLGSLQAAASFLMALFIIYKFLRPSTSASQKVRPSV